MWPNERNHDWALLFCFPFPRLFSGFGFASLLCWEIPRFGFLRLLLNGSAKHIASAIWVSQSRRFATRFLTTVKEIAIERFAVVFSPRIELLDVSCPGEINAQSALHWCGLRSPFDLMRCIIWQLKCESRAFSLRACFKCASLLGFANEYICVNSYCSWWGESCELLIHSWLFAGRAG